ncbi:MAG: hypothetical protein KDA96_00640 [Planctomycetaceae bacterium]|nr:hypothetical protein [Planctomycetaceae bacterium]
MGDASNLSSQLISKPTATFMTPDRSQPETTELPGPVQRLLADVRRRARRDAVISGILLVVAVICTVFWVTTLMDTGWFALQKLELPVGLRAILLAILLPAGLYLLAAQVLAPAMRRIADLDLALLLEKRFPQFQDRLVTTVETQTGFTGDGALGAQMLGRTVAEAGEVARSVQASEVFDSAVVKRRGGIATALLLSIVVAGVISPGMVRRWWDAFIRCEQSYHQRSTDLQIFVIAQPGDRRREFVLRDDQPTYLHPRGADLELEMVVPDGGPRDGVSWVVPERVRVDIRRADGSLSRTYVSATSEKTFRFVITRLQEPIGIDLLAGDFRTTQTWQVDPVAAPGLDTVSLKCDFPEYTGWNSSRETTMAVTGSEMSLPLGTRFELDALTNKPLQSVRIVSDWFEIEGDGERSRVTTRAGRPLASDLHGPLISADGQHIRVSFELQQVPDAQPGTPAGQGQEDPGPALLPTTSPAHLPVPSNATLRFFLHDMDDVMSINPETLRVRGVEDKPPVIVASLKGIDTAITRRATIPITGRIRDDYGLLDARFEFMVDDETNWRPRPFSQSMTAGVMEFELGRSSATPFELFRVEPLDLSEGQALTITIRASDGNTMNGPGITRSEPLLFRIVSNEELLSLLYTREINLRRRFEEVISQCEQIRDDLQFHESIAARLDAGTSESVSEDRIGITTCATRNGNNLRRQANELRSIAEGFEEIVLQLINNQIPPQQLAENMRQQILEPLDRVAETEITQADRAVGEFRASALAQEPTETRIQEARRQVDAIIRSLNQILENVRDMAEFHEILRDLKGIKDDWDAISKELREIQKRELIDKLKLLE